MAYRSHYRPIFIEVTIMKRSITAIGTISVIGAATVIWAVQTKAVTGEGLADLTPAIIVSQLALADGEQTPSYSYVGSSKCKMCHIKEHKTWKKTKMAKALETLRPGQAVDVKKAHNVDPQKDYSTDESCLECHTTGFGHEGGYFVPDAADKKAVRKAKKLAGVGCESCHGPGSEYIKVFMEIFKSQRKYKVEELYVVGLTKIDASTCTVCHNDGCPTIAADTPFDFKKMKDEDMHEHTEMKLRE